MATLESIVQRRFAALELPAALVLPDGRHLGPADASVTFRLHAWRPLVHLATGRVGQVADDYVEGRIDLDGAPRDLVVVADGLLRGDPTRPGALQACLRGLRRAAATAWRHSPEADARQVRRHYDVSEAFFALWLDPLRVYSCAYWREADTTLAQAQQAKLELLCRKLMLRTGDRLLDVGCGWGGLLLWAAEHHGVRATGITLSRHQHAHVQRRIDELGLGGRVQVRLQDYRTLDTPQGFDRIASVGMFEHVGRGLLPRYFTRLRTLLRPGGLLMNHGITAGAPGHVELGAGLGDFIERHIFPGGELVHVSHELAVMATAGLEPLDVENLRPHYARTLWAWSDALERQRGRAREIAGERVLRAWRLYLAGSALAFERGWVSLHQVLAARPSGERTGGPVRGAQSDYPFLRDYMLQRP